MSSDPQKQQTNENGSETAAENDTQLFVRDQGAAKRRMGLHGQQSITADGARQMSNKQQTQQADDPSGPGWRDVGPGIASRLIEE